MVILCTLLARGLWTASNEKSSIDITVYWLDWRNMKEVSKDAILLALAVEHYDASDYIWDYNVLKAEARKGNYAKTDS